MCKAGGPRCPMDHKRRGEVNARRRTRDRATRAYRSGLVSALEEQGHDDLAKIARTAPSGDLAVMAAATGNSSVGEGLDYVPGLKRANEKVSSDVADALNKIDGVEIDPDNRGASLESMGVAAGADTKDPFVTDTDSDDVETMQCTTCGTEQAANKMSGTQCFNCANFGDDEEADHDDFDDETGTVPSVYDNIDTPEKAQAAADAMYAELEHLDRDELAAMNRDELEAMYNKYNAIDNAIRAQGNISADETSGNAFLDLHDVYHGLDEEGLYPDDEDDSNYRVFGGQPATQAGADQPDTELAHLYPVVNDDNRDGLIDETNTLLADTPDDYVNMPQDEFDKVYADKHDKLQNLGRRMNDDDHDDTEFMGDELNNAADVLAREKQERDEVDLMFSRVNEEPDVFTPEKADHAASVSLKMASIQHPSEYSDEELAVKMENLNWIGDGVRAHASDASKRDFNQAYELFAAEVAEREAAADADVSKRAPLLADMDRNDFHAAMTRIGLEDNVHLGDDGTIEYDDIAPLGKLKVANEVRSYERFREDPRAWGRDKYQQTRADWDGNLGWQSDEGSVYVTAEDDVHGDDEVLVEGAYEMPNRVPFVSDEARRNAGRDMTLQVQGAMQERYPDHPGNTAINVELDESGEMFEATVPGHAQDYSVEPKHYYRTLAQVVQDQFKRG